MVLEKYQEDQVYEILDRTCNCPMAPSDPVTRFFLSMDEEDRVKAIFLLGKGDDLYRDVCKELPSDEEIEASARAASDDVLYLYQEWAKEAI